MDRKSARRPNRRIGALVLLVATAVVSGGCSLLPQEQAPLKPPLVKPAQTEARTVDAKLGSIMRQITGSGTFVPTQVDYYQFQEGGVIGSVSVRAGAAVKKGDVLVTLENEGIDIELLQRELEYERKRLAWEETVKGGNSGHIKIAQLDYKLAALLFEKTKEKVAASVLKAEADGIVTYFTDMMPGDRAEPGRVLAAVAEPTGMRLAMTTANNPVLADIKVGMAAEVRFQDQVYAGKVAQTPASAPMTDDDRLREEYSKTLYVELDSLPAEAALGKMADVTIVAARRDNVIVVPKSGVRTYFGRTFVQVLDGERRRELDVETGLETATEYEIVQGVEDGMKIILQ
ncbi:macrolide-specific efflux system membrane fusion protein [Paenibacillus phyllosphaerae]|uniref:Macrolide-specific efflux system membrane fusion protein n=1 Tax=Paenibacillus phyllosphaerae TaxID=274593 RepID=A0A7W5B5M8_9BACL|nr:biotin/lipoyl-binding protein [Paenibacillus phyllosphaerae]MBB3114624.1 macrolide-specific efflux system membrane fusion protein [Paenibacillus phyllosphaerae]